jgi:hypothetical protein
MLGKSLDYLRVASLIYCSSLVVLYYSACFFAGKIIIGTLLVLQLIRIINNPRPNPNYSMLSYNKTAWLLHDNQDQQSSYDRLRVVINTDLFVLVELSTKKHRKLIVIFSDQLTENNYRALSILDKINRQRP